MRLDPVEGDRYAGATSADYANMVGPFGGTIAAVLLNAPCVSPARRGDPAALTVNYCAPVADGGFTIDATPVRTNRSNQHWSIAMRQGDAIVATATAVFAARRDTWSRTEAEPPSVPPADSLERAPTVFRPPWTKRYDMRFVRGGAVALDADHPGETPTTWVWLADDPPRPLDFLSLTALADAFFPRIFVRRPRWTPIGTVSLTIYFHADAPALARQGERPVLGVAWSSRFGHGLFDEHAEVWSDSGDLLASAHQIVYYKD